MRQQNGSMDKRITFGIIMIVIGGIFLLNTLDVIDFAASRIIFSFPFILFIVGILILINSEKKVFGGILTTVGAFLLIPRIFPNIHYGMSLIIPLLLIVLGLYLIFRHSREKDRPDFHSDDYKIRKDTIDDVSIFGGGTKVVTSDNFKGGSITAIFGGSEIDLTNCKLAEGTSVLDIVAIFGGTTLVVPKDWNIQLNVTPLFGGFSNKAFKIPNLEVDKTRVLIIKGVAIFGGGEVKTIYS
jgi:predicted membrane protein